MSRSWTRWSRPRRPRRCSPGCSSTPASGPPGRTWPSATSTGRRSSPARRGGVGAGGAVRRDHRARRGRRGPGGGGVNLPALVEALLFLAPEPVTVEELADALQVSEPAVERALDQLEDVLGERGVVLR